jgi:hypothetical protein
MEIKKSSVQIWRENNKQKLRDDQYRIRATEKRKQYMKEFRKKNIKNKRALQQKHNWDRKIRLLEIVANGNNIECIRCKIKDKRILQIHHKLGNGNRDAKLYYKLDNVLKLNNGDRQLVENLEIRCCNCNIIAEYEDLKRRWSNVEKFDENFNPIWKELPKERRPLKPLICDFCGALHMPNKRYKNRIGQKHYCNRICMDNNRRKHESNPDLSTGKI